MSENTSTLPNFVTIYTQNVIWGDMDAFGHLNNVMYFRYIESARIDFLTKTSALSSGLIAVLAQTSCQYFSPVVYPDKLSIGCNIIETGNTSFKMAYHLWSHQQQKLIGYSEAIVVMFNPTTHQKSPLPDHFRKALSTLTPTLTFKND